MLSERDDKPAKQAWEIALEKRGFSLEKTLVGGITGTVALYKYNGDDPDIKKTCNSNGVILVKVQSTSATPDDPSLTFSQQKRERNLAKHAAVTFNHEWDIVDDMARIQSTKDKLRPKLYAAEFDGIKFIFNEALPAKNIEEQMRVMGAQQNISDEPHQEKVFDQLFANMYFAQRYLHKDGWLHLDSAPRNFIWPGKIIDFGLALKVGEDGRAINDPRFTIIPSHMYDDAARDNKHGEKTILTDLCCLKFGMIESLAHYMQASRFQLSGFLANDNFSQDEDIVVGYHGDNEADSAIENVNVASSDDKVETENIDNKRLQAAFEHLKSIAEHLPDDDSRKGIVMNVMYTYHEFLTSAPTLSNLKDTMQQDYEVFLRCNPTAKLGIASRQTSTAAIADKMGLSALDLKKDLPVKETVQAPVNTASANDNNVQQSANKVTSEEVITPKSPRH